MRKFLIFSVVGLFVAAGIAFAQSVTEDFPNPASFPKLLVKGNLTVNGTTTLVGGTASASYPASSTTSPQFNCTGAAACGFASAAGQNATLDSAGAGTASISVGATNATSVLLGRSGQNTQVNGTLGVTGNTTLSGTLSLPSGGISASSQSLAIGSITSNGNLSTNGITGTSLSIAAAVGIKNTVALSAGSATVTVASGVTCFCTDTTAANAVRCSVSSTTLTLAGTGTDSIAYLCL